MSSTSSPVPVDALSALAAELGIEDRVVASPYVRRFRAEIERATWAPAARARFERAARASDVLLLGEFHPLPSACRTARALVASLAGGRRPLRIGLEMVHARDQHALDAFLAGAIGRREFARRIRYAEEWGYPLTGAYELLDAARAADVPVRGLDIPPRGDAADLRLRDTVAAERIAAESAGPASRRPRWIVVYGEAHLASSHLPARLADALAFEPRVTRVVHDAPLPAAPDGAMHRAAAGLWSIRDAGPAARARALGRVWRRWASDVADPGDVDLALLAHELIDGVAARVGIRPRRHRVAGATRLADLYPEVYGPREAARARRRLREAGFARSATARALAVAAERGALLVEGAPLLVVVRPGMRALSVAAGQFLARTLPPGGARPDEPFDERVAETAFALALARLGTGADGAPWSDSVTEAAAPLASRVVEAVRDDRLEPRAIGRALVSRRGGTLAARLARLTARS